MSIECGYQCIDRDVVLTDRLRTWDAALELARTFDLVPDDLVGVVTRRWGRGRCENRSLPR